MPVEIRARQSRNFQRKYRAYLAHRDIRHQRLEILPPGHLGTRHAQVPVERANRRFAPPQLQRHRSQCILALRALLVVEHLGIRRLAHIDVGRSAPVLFCDLGVHRQPPHFPNSLGCQRATLRPYWRGARHPIQHRLMHGGRAELRSW
jgi:hypothetical protein